MMDKIDRIQALVMSSPYYRSRMKSFCEGNESIDENTVIFNNNDIIRSDITPYELKQCFGFSTKASGIYVPWSQNDYQQVIRSLARKRKKYFGISFTDKSCYNHVPGIGKNPQKILDKRYLSLNGREMYISSVDVEVDDLFNCYMYLADFHPRWICFDVDYFDLLYEYLESNQLSFPDSIEYIELRTQEKRSKYVCKVKSCRYSHVYYHKYLLDYLYEYEPYKYSVLSEIVSVEKQDCEENIMFYVTSLINTTFPLIRHQVTLRKANVASCLINIEA